jgi:hypothetical protein
MPGPRHRSLNRNDTPYRTLAHLANAGPQEPTALRAFMQSTTGATADAAKNTLARVLTSLMDRGLVKTKVWLTPEGLAELHRHGWTPARLEEDEEPAEP